jgi:hypothetical protein
MELLSDHEGKTANTTNPLFSLLLLPLQIQIPLQIQNIYSNSQKKNQILKKKKKKKMEVLVTHR